MLKSFTLLKRPSSRQSSTERSKKYYDCRCEYDVPKGCDLKKELANVEPFDIYKPTQTQMAMMPDFGFFKKIK